MGMKDATELRLGNVVKLDGAVAKVLFQEVRGTGKFGKTVHVKARNLTDGHVIEKSLRAEERMEEVEVTRSRLQYLYKDGDQLVLMDNATYEQFPIPIKAIGKQEIFLKENTEVQALFMGGKPVTIEFPKVVELRVVSAPPGVRGQADTTYKEVELENGLKILTPQFIKKGEIVRINTDDLSYLDRVTTKSLKSEAQPEKDRKESAKKELS